MEARDPDATSTAATTCRLYLARFRSIMSCFHPSGIPSEAYGKSSCVAWAAQQALKEYELQKPGIQVIFTVIDGTT